MLFKITILLSFMVIILNIIICISTKISFQHFIFLIKIFL